MHKKEQFVLSLSAAMIVCGLAFNIAHADKKYGWKNVKGETFYYFPKTTKTHKKGERASGWVNIDGYQYYFFTGSGKYLATGKRYSKYALAKNANIYGVETDKNGRAIRSDNKEGWVKSGSSRKYIDSNGKKLKGFHDIDGETYYFYEKKTNGHYPCQMALGWTNINGYKYYFHESNGTDYSKGSLYKTAMVRRSGKSHKGTSYWIDITNVQMTDKEFRDKILENCEKFKGVPYSMKTFFARPFGKHKHEGLDCYSFVSLCYRYALGTISYKDDWSWYQGYAKYDNYGLGGPGVTGVTLGFLNPWRDELGVDISRKYDTWYRSEHTIAQFIKDNKFAPGDVIIWYDKSGRSVHIGIYAGIKDGVAYQYHCSEIAGVIKVPMKNVTYSNSGIRYFRIFHVTNPDSDGTKCRISNENIDVFADKKLKKKADLEFKIPNFVSKESISETLYFKASSKGPFDPNTYKAEFTISDLKNDCSGKLKLNITNAKTGDAVYSFEDESFDFKNDSIPLTNNSDSEIFTPLINIGSEDPDAKIEISKNGLFIARFTDGSWTGASGEIYEDDYYPLECDCEYQLTVNGESKTVIFNSSDLRYARNINAEDLFASQS